MMNNLYLLSTCKACAAFMLITPMLANLSRIVAVQRMHRKNAQQTLTTTTVDGLSDQFVIDVGAEEMLFWGRAMAYKTVSYER